MSTASLVLVLVLAVLALVGLWYGLKYYNTRYVLDLSLNVANRYVTRGETVKFKIVVRPSRDVSVPEIFLKLRCIRRDENTYNESPWRYGRYDLTDALLNMILNRTAVADDVQSEYEGRLSQENLTFRAGETRELDAEFPVPADALHTNHEGKLQIRWYLIAEVRTGSGLPAEVKEEIVVTYGRAVSGGAAGDPSALFPPKTQERPQPSPPQNASPFGHLELDGESGKEGEGG